MLENLTESDVLTFIKGMPEYAAYRRKGTVAKEHLEKLKETIKKHIQKEKADFIASYAIQLTTAQIRYVEGMRVKESLDFLKFLRLGYIYNDLVFWCRLLIKTGTAMTLFSIGQVVAGMHLINHQATVTGLCLGTGLLLAGGFSHVRKNYFFRAYILGCNFMQALMYQ